MKVEYVEETSVRKALVFEVDRGCVAEGFSVLVGVIPLQRGQRFLPLGLAPLVFDTERLGFLAVAQCDARGFLQRQFLDLAGLLRQFDLVFQIHEIGIIAAALDELRLQRR